jgi:hypothetical protein
MGLRNNLERAEQLGQRIVNPRGYPFDAPDNQTVPSADASQ